MRLTQDEWELLVAMRQLRAGDLESYLGVRRTLRHLWRSEKVSRDPLRADGSTDSLSVWTPETS